jgi:hypothetical protein
MKHYDELSPSQKKEADAIIAKYDAEIDKANKDAATARSEFLLTYKKICRITNAEMRGLFECGERTYDNLYNSAPDISNQNTKRILQPLRKQYEMAIHTLRILKDGRNEAVQKAIDYAAFQLEIF